jgi:prolyl-tRNA editing enzyme YbaK/EbsC (Cys-tRNA(Pro) deacylase)
MLEAERILHEKGIPYRLIELTDRAMTVADVARYSKGDINVDEICKTVIMRDDSGNRYAFLLVGTDRVDPHKAKRLTGRKLSVASPEEVHDSTGADPGAVCPLTLRIPLTIDQRVLDLERVNFGSGHHLYGIEMKTENLLRAVPHTVADIAEERATQ